MCSLFMSDKNIYINSKKDQGSVPTFPENQSSLKIKECRDLYLKECRNL